jgi:aconitase A
MTQREVEKLQDRVKDLERKTVFDIFDTEACLNRIEKLEEWKKNTLEHRFGQRINELEDKTETLEEWHKQEHINKSTDTALAKVWMQDLTQLKEKVKDLEEWKRLHLTTSHFNKCYEPEIVPIDKKVWEQIKHLISQIDNHDLTFGGGMSYLKDAIKKAEGSND